MLSFLNVWVHCHHEHVGCGGGDKTGGCIEDHGLFSKFRGNVLEKIFVRFLQNVLEQQEYKLSF